MKAIIGKKVGMTQVYKDEKVAPVTLIDVVDCKVVYKDADGIELGYDKKKKPTRAELGKYKALGYVPKHRQYFYKLESDKKIGDLIEASTFEDGELVEIVGVSKGKGFQGVMKRWGFHGGDRTHGQSDRERAPGSIGAGTDPGRVLKGKKMPGRMGGQRIHNENKKVVKVEGTIIAIRGSVPGNRGDKVIIMKK